MRAVRVVLWGACLSWTATCTQAQEYPYGTPALLPLAFPSAGNVAAASFPQRPYPHPPQPYQRVQPYHVAQPYPVAPRPYPGMNRYPSYYAIAQPADAPPVPDAASPGPTVWEEANPYGAGYGSCDSCGCEPCSDPCACGGCFFGGTGSLIMTRDRPNGVWLTFDNTNPNTALLGSAQNQFDYAGGFEVWFGGRVDANRVWEVRYWTLDPFEETAGVRSLANLLNTPINLGTLQIMGANVDTLMDAAREHRFARRNEIHNVEINLINQPIISNSNFSMDWLFGVRYFRFHEGWLFSAVAGGFEFGNNGGVQEVNYDVDVTNNLTGAQVGGRAEWALMQYVTGFVAPKVGLYGNRISHRSQFVRGDGASAFNIKSKKTDVSIMAECEIGLSAELWRNWQGHMAYRVLAVSGVGLSDNQIPPFIQDFNGIAAIDSNGHLLLHGAVFGVEKRY